MKKVTRYTISPMSVDYSFDEGDTGEFVLSEDYDELLLELEKLRQPRPINDPEHPEAFCQECSGVNPSWHAPNILWNQVMKNEITKIICPVCFEKRALKLGITIQMIADTLNNSLDYDTWERYSREK